MCYWSDCAMYRVSHALDLPGLLRRSSHGSFLGPRCRRGEYQSMDHCDNDSEESQVLYMASTRKQNRRESKASSNSYSERLSNTQELEKENSAGAREHEIWSLIEKEIADWQYVCRTGRPYWEMAASKSGRKQLHQSLDGPAARISIVKSRRETFDNPRRALSDSFLEQSAFSARSSTDYRNSAPKCLLYTPTLSDD